MSRKVVIPRRTFLHGLGTAMALPLLDAMHTTGYAKETETGNAPRRMAFVFFPNGAIMPDWKPIGKDRKFSFSKTLKPLERHRDSINILGGLTQHHGRSNGDGAGDHARCAAVYLTGAQARKTSGADIHLGISADQVAARQIGKQTRLRSLELGVDRGRNAGGCDSGYSCAYSSNISWSSATTPNAKEINPRLVFERLFGSDLANESDIVKKKRELYRRSILDLVSEDAARLRNKLGQTDRRKIDEYFTSVRELEQRITKSAKEDEIPQPEMARPAGIPREYEEHVRLMYDLMAVAFQTDTTRIATFMVGNAGSNRSYHEVGVKSGWHQLSHHRRDKKKMQEIQRIDQYLIEQFAYFLDKLNAIKEKEGTLLDNSMIVYGSGISDGDRHQHHDLPIVLAGGGGGTIQTGRHVVYKDETPLNNLFLAMMNRAGADVKEFGDSTGQLGQLDG